VIKNAPFRPVIKIRFCGKFSWIVPGMACIAEGRRSGPDCPIHNYYLREILAEKTLPKKVLG
jgi:hypothetical protein